MSLASLVHIHLLYMCIQKTILYKIYIGFLFFTTPLYQTLASTLDQISNTGDVSHFEISNVSPWQYQVQRKENLVELTLPALKETDLAQLLNYSDSRISSIKVNKNGPDSKYIVSYHLKSGSIDFFNYMSDSPSKLILDFFSKNENKENEKEIISNKFSASKAASISKTNKQSIKVSRQVKESIDDPKRQPATSDVLVLKDEGLIKKTDVKVGRIFDSGDYNLDRFNIKDFEIKETSIISSEENVFLQFPMLHLQSSLLEKILANKPLYEIIPKDTEENKEARFLVTLFENKRYNIFLKTVEWFNKKYPNSEYDEIIRFMMADSYFNIWLDGRNVNDFDLAILRYRQAIETYPESTLAERTLLLMGYGSLDRGDYYATLRLLQSNVEKRNKSEQNDIVRLGIAETLLRINRYDEAYKMYDSVSSESVGTKPAEQADFSKGDVYCQRKSYAQAIDEYKKAIEKHPQSAQLYPNVYYNLGLALFNEKKYKESLNNYLEFLKNYQKHNYSAYALTRIGELLQIMGAPSEKVQGAFLETYFRFGEDPSAIVARLRILSERMKDLKPKEVEKAVKDITELSHKSNLEGINQFAALMISDGYSQRKEYDTAIDLLIKYYQEHPTDSDTELLQKRIVKTINEKISFLVDKGQFVEALNVHRKYVDSWLKGSKRIDTKYNIARSYEQAGVYDIAEIMFQDTLNRIYALKGTKSEKERSILEKLPEVEELNLRMAVINFNNGKLNSSMEFLSNIKDPTKLSEKSQIERVELASKLYAKRGDINSAIRYLTDLILEWRGQPALISQSYYLLGQLEIQKNKEQDALQSFQRVDELMKDSEKVDPMIHIKSLDSMANIYLKQSKREEAAKVFENILKGYENKFSLDSTRYKWGEIYFQDGELQKANEIWNDLKDKKDPFWYKLAQEHLKNSQWESDYKKYIKRIPAMAGKEEVKK